MIEKISTKENGEKKRLSPEEKKNYLDNMEKYAKQLAQAIDLLKIELISIEDTDELQKKKDLIHEGEEEVKRMKEYVEEGRNSNEDSYRLK